MDKSKFESLLLKLDDKTRYFGEPKVLITLHQKSQSKEYYYLCKDYYDDWIDKFHNLIQELMKGGNGFYVTD